MMAGLLLKHDDDIRSGERLAHEIALDFIAPQ
jgi:hypothetical protein